MRADRANSWRAILLAAILLAGVPARAAGEVKLVAHAAVDTDRMDPNTVTRIFLGKQTRWTDDSRIVPVMLETGPVHEEFVTEVLGRSVDRFNTYWRQKLFTGKGVPPRAFRSETELLAFVAKTPGAIGYVEAGTAATGVRVMVLE